MGARYGYFPTQVWESLPPRLISRYYLLIQREMYRQQMFQVAVHGGESDEHEPSWMEDQTDEPTPPPMKPKKKPCPEGFVTAMVPAEEGGLREVRLEKGSAEYRKFFGE